MDSKEEEEFYINQSKMLRLNDFLNPENNNRGIAERRSLKNSLKRNTILPYLESTKLSIDSEYESKLTSHNFCQKDLLIVLEHIYNKNEMSLSDRNFIKRTLLLMFPEDLIFTAGKQLIEYTKFVSIQKGTHQIGNGMLNLIIKGNLILKSEFYVKTVREGEYFGHLELLTGMPNSSLMINAESETFMICINKEGFDAEVSDYFRRLYENKMRVVPKILGEKLKPIQSYLLYEKMSKKCYGIGEKMSKKGEKIREIMFIEEGECSKNTNCVLSTIDNNLKTKIENTVGLSELINNITTHLSNNFTTQHTKTYTISLEQFYQIINQSIIQQIKEQLNNKNNPQSCLTTQIPKCKTEPITNLIANTKIWQAYSDRINNFTQIKSVKLPYCQPKSSASSDKKSPKNSRISNFSTSFVFIKNEKAFEKNRQGRLDRAFKIMRPEVASLKSFIDYFEAPFVEKNKEYPVG